MDCPVDGTQLRITQSQGIEIDYCPRCRGVWLDRGELDKLIERSLLPAGGERYGEREYDRDDRRREESRYYEGRHHGDDDDRDDDDDERHGRHVGGERRSQGRRGNSFLRDVFNFD